MFLKPQLQRAVDKPQTCFGSGNAITNLQQQLCHTVELARNARQPQEEQRCCGGWPLMIGARKKIQSSSMSQKGRLGSWKSVTRCMMCGRIAKPPRTSFPPKRAAPSPYHAYLEKVYSNLSAMSAAADQTSFFLEFCWLTRRKIVPGLLEEIAFLLRHQCHEMT